MSQSLKARVYLDTNRTISPISPLLFSGFAEHMGRSIYEGIYDPASPHADERGLRNDVMAALRELNFRAMRYPGGNFLSGYRWLDGVGPKDQRPRRRDLAWQSIETNQFGTNEFMEFCKAVNTEPMLGGQHGHRARFRMPPIWSNTAMRPPAHNMPTCAPRTATPIRMGSNIGVSATRWMAPGRSDIWKPKITARRPAKPPR